MGFLDFESHFIEEFHKMEDENRRHYCKERFNRICDDCNHFWCESNPKHEKNLENDIKEGESKNAK